MDPQPIIMKLTAANPPVTIDFITSIVIRDGLDEVRQKLLISLFALWNQRNMFRIFSPPTYRQARENAAFYINGLQ